MCRTSRWEHRLWHVLPWYNLSKILVHKPSDVTFIQDKTRFSELTEGKRLQLEYLQCLPGHRHSGVHGKTAKERLLALRSVEPTFPLPILLNALKNMIWLDDAIMILLEALSPVLREYSWHETRLCPKTRGTYLCVSLSHRFFVQTPNWPIKNKITACQWNTLTGTI